jgi:hypothetical protein
VQPKQEDEPLSDAPEKTDWAEIEKRLETHYVSFFQESMSMPEEVARQIFAAFAEEQKEAARGDGTDKLPENFGEILLEREQTDEHVRAVFLPKRAEGVTDEDIAFWWNMPDLERRLICKVDEMNRMLLFDQLMKGGGVTDKEAARMVAKQFPIYGDPNHLVLDSEDDRPLPFELKWRVNRFISQRTATDAATFHAVVESSTSLNAVLRQALRLGEL